MSILVTGGLGYIGSHTVIQLIESEYKVIIIDNLYNSTMKTFDNIKLIAAATLKKNPDLMPLFYKVDCCNLTELSATLKHHTIQSIIHFAAYKAVSESISHPLLYYQNNLVSTMNLLTVAQTFQIPNFIFSSSCTVYSNPATVPIKETSPTGSNLTNVYAKTKFMCETIINDFRVANPTVNVIKLRYFNPIGNHPSGILGDDPSGIPNNLIPYIQKVLTGELPILNIYGSDYNTPDGTGMRDFIHVIDLANAHIKSIEYCIHHSNVQLSLNVGTGRPYSVLEIVWELSKAAATEIAYQFCDRRSGDLGIMFCDPAHIQETLHWKAKFTLEDMCRDIVSFVNN